MMSSCPHLRTQLRRNDASAFYIIRQNYQAKLNSLDRPHLRDCKLNSHYVLQLLNTLLDLLHFSLHFFVILSQAVEDVMDGLVFKQVGALPNRYLLP